MNTLIVLVTLCHRLLLISLSAVIALAPLFASFSLLVNLVVMPSLLLALFGSSILIEQRIETWKASFVGINKPESSSKKSKCVIPGCPIFH